MKKILTLIAFGALLASAASARPLHARYDAGLWAPDAAIDAMDDVALGARRSNLNPRDPAYTGSDTVDDERSSDYYDWSAH
jgi:hypothetical protein